ncbi:hypothetical protein PVK06_007626 [Gossypium arboreum]|uniref:Uncharacterized protein n=1 Tax=Gossypium arboreum TaxID=29729 RepID=A0ABR0QI56_GOSAR|nr:hypothetical protein PVK06_007626 [Gossypium arboreum]
MDGNLMPYMVCWDGRRWFVGYMVTEHAVLSIPGTNILGGLRACWKRVWMASRAHNPFCKLLRCMRAKTKVFPKFLRTGSATLACELGHWLCLTS